MSSKVNKSSVFMKYKSALTGITGLSILHINHGN